MSNTTPPATTNNAVTTTTDNDYHLDGNIIPTNAQQQEQHQGDGLFDVSLKYNDAFSQKETSYIRRSKPFFASNTSFSWINDVIINPFGLSSIGLLLLFVVLGLVQLPNASEDERKTLYYARLVPKIFAIVIALYSDDSNNNNMTTNATTTSTNVFRRKPILWIGFIGLLLMNFCITFGFLTIPVLGEVVVLLQQTCLCMCMIVGDAMRVERAIYGGDGGNTLLLCQGTYYIGCFLRSLIDLVLPVLIVRNMIVTVFLPFILLMPFLPHLKDVVRKQEQEQDTTTTLEDNNTVDNLKSRLLRRYEEIGWDIFALFQTKPVLYAVSFTLVLVTTITCVQVMNIFDGYMDWYIADQWAYSLIGVLAVLLYLKFLSTSNWHYIWASSAIGIGVLCMCGYLSNFALRWGNVLIGGLVVLSQLPLLEVFLGLVLPGYEATTFYLYQLVRTIIGREMGDQWFFATTFFQSWYWISYVSLLIPVVLLFTAFRPWIPTSKQAQQQQLQQQQEQQQAQAQAQQQKQQAEAQEGSTNDANNNTVEDIYFPKLFIGLILIVVVFFALVQLFWTFGYKNTTDTNDDDYYYYYYSSQDFWYDWIRFQRWKQPV